MDNILEIKNLHTYFYTDNSVIKAVEGVNLSVRRGEVLGVVGESACGKSVMAYSLLRLVDSPGRIVDGEIVFEGRNLLAMADKEIRPIRGGEISMIFQDPVAALNPLYSVGYQIEEALKIHRKDLNRDQRQSVIVDLIQKVGISDAPSRKKDYPHQFSGGQAQRIMIAISLCCNPKLLIADEPTTSLDVTIQAQIIDLFVSLRQTLDFTLILITHDLALCAQVADRIAIMYSGKIVELASRDVIINNPKHPYTKALFNSMPTEIRSKRKLQVIKGEVPDPTNKPKGCHFNPRCPLKTDICEESYPQYRQLGAGHWVSCFHADCNE